jgi:hypothetical protein
LRDSIVSLIGKKPDEDWCFESNILLKASFSALLVVFCRYSSNDLYQTKRPASKRSHTSPAQDRRLVDQYSLACHTRLESVCRRSSSHRRNRGRQSCPPVLNSLAELRALDGHHHHQTQSALDGTSLFVGPVDSPGQVWELTDTPTLRATLPVDFGGINVCAVSPDGKLLVAAGDGWRP